MTWLLTWLNESVATLNATLQLLVIYRLDESHLISSTSKILSYIWDSLVFIFVLKVFLLYFLPCGISRNHITFVMRKY